MVEHRLLDIVTIAVCAVICGADDWTKVQVFGQARSTGPLSSQLQSQWPLLLFSGKTRPNEIVDNPKDV
jgi:hypothetical protein